MVYLGLGIVALLVVGAAHWYLWKRLVADVSRPGGRWRRIGTVLIVLLGLLVPATLIGGRLLSPTGAGRILAWPGYLWLALLLYLLLALAVLEIPRALGRRRAREHRSGVRSGAGPESAPMALGRRRAREHPRGDGPRASQRSEERNGPEPSRKPSGVRSGAGPESAPTPVPEEVWRPGGVAGIDAVPPPRGGLWSGEVEPEPEPVRPAGTPIDPERRRFLARSLALVAGVAATGTVGYGVATQLHGPVVKRVSVPLRRLDPQIDGFRIAVVSDLHLGPILQRGFAERVVATINDQAPDLITIVGDLADGSVAELGRAAEPLRRLSAPHGAYFVTGNHEYYSGVTQWVEEIRDLGVHPLRNQHTEIIGGRTTAFDLAGVNDATGGDYSPSEAPNYDAALHGRDPHRAVVLLAHQPVQVHQAARRGVDLQLSGHTHGGQLWPLRYAVRLQQPVVSGLARIDRTWLYVTSGAGAWGPPVRVGARPDITVVTLHSTR